MPDNFLASNPQELERSLHKANRKIEEQQAMEQAKARGLPYLNLQIFPLDLNALSLIPKKTAEEIGAVVIHKEGKDLKLGVTNPENARLKEELQKSLAKYSVQMFLISHSSLLQTFSFYDKITTPLPAKPDTVVIEPGLDYNTLIKTLATSPGASLSDELAGLFGAALQFNATDIHLEPEAKFCKVRFRIDGLLQDTTQFGYSIYTPLLSRIKGLAKLKINIKNEPQDGSFTIRNGSTPIDIRVSVIPSVYGEALVLRLLGVGSEDASVNELGLMGLGYKLLTQALEKPNGMIINTGPTGSGKTTTLYACLKLLNKPGVKIITLEDPVEYKLEGIQQTPIDHHVDFSFAKGLRAILRQDPDIVMVGEIRDEETASAALQAALTGHLVLSTIHTNDASGVVPRLITMGAKPFVIAPALSLIIAQRLVRKLCPECKQETKISGELQKKVTELLETIPKEALLEIPKKHIFYKPVGCQACNGLGYKGRLGVFEIIEVNSEIQELILKQASANDIWKVAKSNGSVTMSQDGVVKALNGVTDLEEVFRVTG